MTVQFDVLEKDELAEIPALEADLTAHPGYYASTGKRYLDLILIAIAAPVWIPLMVLVTAVLLLSGQRPFYLQERIGLDGETFRMLKFRTMVPNAEEALRRHLASDPAARREWDDVQKLRNDPRVTRMGRIMRKTSLDEVPQLLNVLKGDMSLVGPRPMLPEQRALYPGSAYFRMRPGITGAWQVSDRNNCAFRDRAVHDSRYEATMSFFGDLRLLVLTVRVVLRGTGC